MISTTRSSQHRDHPLRVCGPNGGSPYCPNMANLSHRAINYVAGDRVRGCGIIVTPNVGVTYSGSTTMIADHGGFAHDNTNVVMLIANPQLQASTVSATTTTTQIAPTIIEALGLDPSSLDAVREEGTAVLPEVETQLAR